MKKNIFLSSIFFLLLLAAGCSTDQTATFSESNINEQTNSAIQPPVIGDEISSLPKEETFAEELPTDIIQAEDSLEGFFDMLSKHNYSQGMSYYGGGYEMIYSWNTDVDKYDKSKLWERACEQNGLQCLSIRKILTKRKVKPKLYQFSVQFNNNDGTLFKSGPCCGSTEGLTISEFTFDVQKVNLNYYVTSLPPYRP